MVLLNSKNIIILGIIAFLAISFWSLSSMSMDMSGRMVNCPFHYNFSSFCQMNVSEHITQWQLLFTAIRNKNFLLPLFYVLIFTQVVLLFIKKKINQRLRYQFRNYFYWHKPEIKLFDQFALAFSRGIIQPKIYV